MNLVSIAQGRSKSLLGNAYGVSGSYPLGTPYSTIDKKDRAPVPAELIANLTGTAFACANLNANAVASTPLRLYVRTGKGQRQTRWMTEPVGSKSLRWLQVAKRVTEGFVIAGGKVSEVKQHPLLTLMDIGDGSTGDEDADDSGQPRLLGHHLLWATQIFLETIGRAYWLIERDGLGVPQKIWLLRSQLVREVLNYESTDGQIVQYYEYGGGAGTRYDPADIIRFANPDPSLLYVGGYSPMQAAIEKIRLGRRSDAMLNAILQNMGYPGAILSPKGEDIVLSGDTAKRVRSQWDREFMQSGAGGTVTLPQGFDVTFPQWKPTEIIPLDKAKAIKNDICNVFGVPDAKLERNAANRASAETADYAHAKDATLPRCSSMESVFRRLVRMFDDSGRMFLAFDNPVPSDEVFVQGQMEKGLMVGAITRNEYRAWAGKGMEPVPWGDAPLVLNTMVAVDEKTGKPEASVVSDAPKGRPDNSLRESLRAAGYADDEAAAAIIKHAGHLPRDTTEL